MGFHQQCVETAGRYEAAMRRLDTAAMRQIRRGYMDLWRDDLLVGADGTDYLAYRAVMLLIEAEMYTVSQDWERVADCVEDADLLLAVMDNQHEANGMVHPRCNAIYLRRIVILARMKWWGGRDHVRTCAQPEDLIDGFWEIIARELPPSMRHLAVVACFTLAKMAYRYRREALPALLDWFNQSGEGALFAEPGQYKERVGDPMLGWWFFDYEMFKDWADGTLTRDTLRICAGGRDRCMSDYFGSDDLAAWTRRIWAAEEQCFRVTLPCENYRTELRVVGG